MNNRKLSVALYDDHSFDPAFEFNRLPQNDPDYEFEIYELGRKPIGAHFVLISDGLASTKLPYFFPKNRRVCWLKESPLHTRRLDTDELMKTFDVILTHREDLIKKGPPFYRVDFSSNWIFHEGYRDIGNEKNSLTSFIGNINHLDEAGYPLRKEVAKFLLQRNDVDCFGRGIRPIDFKLEALGQYCFSIAMENFSENFYYTEKIIDCFMTETVPIYWGCPAIDDIFNPQGIISFSTVDELKQIIETLTFQKYQEMLPYVRENKIRCQNLKLSNYDDYLWRCARASEDAGVNVSRPLAKWEMLKAMAGLRYMYSKLESILSAFKQT